MCDDGGMLEGLLLAKINLLKDKKEVFMANNTPKDKNGKILELKDWKLKDFINVSHELGWISKTAKDISEVLRDYRNYIHPQKEYSYKAKLSSKDAITLWEITKTITRELLN